MMKSPAINSQRLFNGLSRGLTDNALGALRGIKGSGSHLQSHNVRLDENNAMYRSKYHVRTLFKN